MPRDAAPRPAPGEASAPSAAASAARSRQLRSRLAVAVASAVAIAFVLTIAVVAGSPPPRPPDDAAAPPATAPTDAPAGSRTPSPTSEPTPRPEPRPTPAPAAPSPSAEAVAPAPPADTTPPPEPVGPRETAPASPVERSPDPNDHGAPLWGRWFSAETLRQGDELAIVAGDAPLHVGFLRQETGDRLVWMTSCNTFGGELAVRRDRLRVRDIGGTAASCDDEVQEDQEAWLRDFFAAGPTWRSLGERLRLWTPDGRRIDLVEDREGPGPPWS